MSKKECVIIVFTKTPVAGTVKTRLISVLGEEGAAELYITLLTNTLNLVKASQIGDIQLWCYPVVEYPLFDSYVKDFNVDLHIQEGNDLGDRMYLALSNALGNYKSVLLVGCDCPELSIQDLKNAAGQLKNSCEIVLGPAEDGGYYLVGGTEFKKEYFTKISWGEVSVLEETRERLNKSGVNWYELETHWDLDRPEDLRRFENLKTV